ncbi:MAG TPA: 50S ribosomal protein L5 [Candidatus Saccharimonadales bacterium]|nr:50S ribosomal protein L5 [Candidatus Saccharimonadales bacterium]
MYDTKELYLKNVAALQSELSIKNVNALPKLQKVSLNVGLGVHKTNKEMISYIEQSLTAIAGQKPVMTHARKAIAGFKLRTGDLVGMRVTLRGSKMTDFLNRLINVTLPRIREFRGIEQTQFDKQGNLTIGFKDQVSFPELGNDVMDKPFGLSVTITVKNSNPAASAVVLKALGFPFKKS